MKDFSILISTWNNCQRLQLTLDTLAQMIIPKGLTWELVIVNNACTDQTDEVVRRFISRLPLIYAKEPLRGLSRARNKGLSMAAGQLVIFTDDDVKPSPDWILVYWSVFKQYPEGYFFGGPIVSDFENPDFDRELLNFAPPSVKGLDWGQDIRVLNKGEYFIAANWACPRETLLRCGAFNIHKGLGASGNRVSIGEENDLMARLQQEGWKPLYVPEAKIYHFVPKSKCTLKHIANRCEASGFEHASLHIDAEKDHFIAGIPRWMFKRYLFLWKKLVLSKMRGEKGYSQCLQSREMMGIMKGAFNLQNRNQR